MAIDGLVVNKGLIKKGQDLGAFNVVGPPLHDEQDYLALAITYLAGVVGENIHLLGADVIKGKKAEIIADNSIMDWISAGGDLPAFNNVAFAFSLFYPIDKNKLKEFCLLFLIDFLTDKEVWFMVEKLCAKLLRTHRMKLSEEELESVYRQIGWDDNKRREYLSRLGEVLTFCQ